jgi:hypothetical protein
MPKIDKLVSVDGKLGVVLDSPPGKDGPDSVIILTEEELQQKLVEQIEACARIADERAAYWDKGARNGATKVHAKVCGQRAAEAVSIAQLIRKLGTLS